MEREGVWWREVRPFFFRPVLPFAVLSNEVAPPSFRASIGGFQYLVSAEAAANSAMDFLVFRAADRYNLEELKAGRRWEVRSAAKRFVVRPIVEAREFAEAGHPIYVAFFERTGYSYLSQRVKRDRFRGWAEALFRDGGALVLGAFSGTEMVAASVSRRVDDTLLYSTFFARYEAMRHHVSSLMLHAVREAARDHREIRTVFAGMRKSGQARSVDEFYLLRGATIETRPARLCVNAAASIILRIVRPTLLRRLKGGGG